MAHFAEIDENNIVIRVLVTDNEAENEGYDFLVDTFGGRWIKTSYNTSRGTHILGGEPLRANFASIGYTYDEEKDVFIPQKPDEEQEWVLNEDGYFWELA
jgi:hypothetical protein